MTGKVASGVPLDQRRLQLGMLNLQLFRTGIKTRRIIVQLLQPGFVLIGVFPYRLIIL